MAFRSSLTFFQCSTPFGIKGFCTSHRTVTSTASSARSAQRLSASKVSAHRGGRYEVELFHQCSTPFGIKGFCTCTPALNRGGWRNGSAQRLSASKVSALRQATASRDSHTVLNAFRHQRFLHRWLGTQRLMGIAVLCSTPFGIKDFCTGITASGSTGRRTSTCAQRLSASKVSALGECLHVFQHEIECSTPFGIKGFCTCKVRWSTSSRRCAQRLSASKVSAPRRWEVSLQLADTCSTPFGIKGFCTLRPKPWETLPLACSTPFGIKGFCTRVRVVETDNQDFQCSTPFGIKGFCTYPIGPIWE